MEHEDLVWRTSTFSGGNGGGCVEVARHPDGAVLVRDTKDRSRPAHRHTAVVWDTFLVGVRDGTFDPA